jgi:hypothetical protein
MEIKQAIIEWAAGILLFIVLMGGLVGFVWLANA